MIFFFFLFVILLIIVIISLLKLKGLRDSGNEVWPFYAKKLLTRPEQVLYFRLIQALPEYLVFAQVSLSQILGVKKGSKGAWRNRINQMSVDFVVCNKDSSVVVVIELDDSTHARPDRFAADEKKDRALTSAGVHIKRFS